MNNKFKGALVASAVGAMFAAVAPGCATATDGKTSEVKTASSAQVMCQGVNECKGHGSCKGAQNSCKGQNECKGKGVTPTGTADECTGKGGTVATAAPAPAP